MIARILPRLSILAIGTMALAATVLPGADEAAPGTVTPSTTQPAAAASQPVSTAGMTVEERLSRLENELNSLRQENQQLRAQLNMSVVASTAATAAAAATSDASDAPSAAASTKAEAAVEAASAAAAATVAAAVKGTQPDATAQPSKPLSGITPPSPPPSAKPPPVAEPLPAVAVVTTPSTSIIKPAGTEQMLSVGGFIQAQAEFGDAVDSRFVGTSDDDPENDRFYLRRARVVVAGRFAEDFEFKVSAELTGALSASSGMRGQLADGYISWTKYPAMNLTIGQFKTSYGHEFLSNDLTIYPIEHALVTDMLTLGRQVGGQASGTFFHTRLNYTIGAFNGNGVNTSVNDNNNFLYTGRVNFAPVKQTIPVLKWDAIWTAGFNAYSSKDVTVTLPTAQTVKYPGKREGYGIDTQVKIGPVDIWYEYLRTKFQPDNPTSTLGTTTADGWYLQGVWLVVPNKWQALLRYDEFDPDIDTDNNETKTWTVGVNYLIKGDDLKLMLNYMWSKPNSLTRPSEDPHRILLRMQAAF